MQSKCIGIVGCTASGKSSVGVRLANTGRFVIINGDSCQLYKGLDILCAKTEDSIEFNRSHKLYSFLDLENKINVYQWAHLAIKEIDTAINEGKIPVILGGTGLYFKVLKEGITKLPKVRELHYTKDEVVKKLRQHDPEVLLYYKDPRRLNRALAIKIQEGCSILDYFEKGNLKLMNHDFDIYALIPDPDTLKHRIDLRLEQQIIDGVEEEVRNFHAASCHFIGYNEIKQNLPNWKELVAIRTKQYAKTQRCFIKNSLEVAKFFDNTDDLANEILKKYAA